MQKQQPQEASQVATEDVATRIERILASHNTVLFMKGVPLLLLLHSKPPIAKPLVHQSLLAACYAAPA